MKGVLVKSVHRRYAVQLVNLERFVQQWQKVEEIILGEKTTRLDQLTEKLHSMRWRGQLGQLLDHFNGLVQEYRQLGGELSETELCNALLRTLPSNYSQFVAVLRREERLHQEGRFEVEELLSSLRAAQVDMRERSKPKGTNQNRRGGFGKRSEQRVALALPKERRTRTKQRQPGGKCFVCGKEGHFARNCPERKRRNDVSSDEQSNLAGKEEVAFTTGAHPSQQQQQVSFILDSGASVHMTNNFNLLNDPVEVETRIGTVAADTQVVARKKGTIEITCRN